MGDQDKINAQLKKIKLENYEIKVKFEEHESEKAEARKSAA